MLYWRWWWYRARLEQSTRALFTSESASSACDAGRTSCLRQRQRNCHHFFLRNQGFSDCLDALYLGTIEWWVREDPKCEALRYREKYFDFFGDARSLQCHCSVNWEAKPSWLSGWERQEGIDCQILVFRLIHSPYVFITDQTQASERYRVLTKRIPGTPIRGWYSMTLAPNPTGHSHKMQDRHVLSPLTRGSTVGCWKVIYIVDWQLAKSVRIMSKIGNLGKKMRR